MTAESEGVILRYDMSSRFIDDVLYPLLDAEFAVDLTNIQTFCDKFSQNHPELKNTLSAQEIWTVAQHRMTKDTDDVAAADVSAYLGGLFASEVSESDNWL